LQLHEQTRRFILLLIFYLLGPILTLGIIGGIVLRKLPSNARHWERTLTQQTGLHWKIKSVEYRSPGVVRLHSVEILDDTAQKPIVFAAQIDVRRITDTSREKIFPGISMSANAQSSWSGLTAVLADWLPSLRSDEQYWQITAPNLFLIFKDYSSDDSALLVQNTLRKVSARFESFAEVPIQFIFEDIYVVSEHSLQREGNKIEDKADIFRLVQGNIYRTPTDIRSDWAFEIKDISNTDRLHLSFALSLTNTLEITFQTGRQPIPCGLAAVFCAPFSRFSGGTFQGKFVQLTRSTNNSRTIRLENVVFQNVPLAPLVGPYTDFAVTGTIVNLQFDRAVFGSEGIDVDGRLRVENGAVDAALLHRCVGNFDLKVEPESALDSPMHMIPFTASAIHFRLQPTGIDFWADKLWYNALMYREADVGGVSEMIVRLPTHRRLVTYHELMSIFASDSAPTVPLTPGLQSILPLVPIQ